MDQDDQISCPLIEKDSQDTFAEEHYLIPLRNQRKTIVERIRPRSMLLLLSWIGSLGTFLVSLAILLFALCLIHSSQQQCVEQLSTASPGLEAVRNWEWRQFAGSVFGEGPYKGPPTDEVLARWEKLATPVAFSIDAPMLENIGGSKDSVKIPDELGGGYMAIFEVHHQLHCLSQLWKNTWPELANADASNASTTFRRHLDHCADILRQQLQCNGDVSVIPQSWVKHVSAPTPNFNVWRKCRSYDAITAWEEEHGVSAPNGRFPKPADAVELEEFP